MNGRHTARLTTTGAEQWGEGMHGIIGPTWTTQRVALLRELWDRGMSASLIAMELRGVTRNAVLGKVFRLGLPARPAKKSPPGPNKRGRPKVRRNRLPQRASEERNAAILPEVKRLAAKGYSSGHIAAAIEASTEQQCTIQRIVGICRRNGIKLPRSRYEDGSRPYEQSRPTVSLRPLPPPPEPKKLSLEQLTVRTCRWPCGDPKADLRFCGHDCPSALPYCTYHMRVAYREGTSTPLERRVRERLEAA